MERIEDIAVRSGFKYPVPINSFLFASGDGDVIEDAPLGYYNLHYFNASNSDPKGIFIILLNYSPYSYIRSFKSHSNG